MSLAAPTIHLAVDAALTGDTSYMLVAVDRGVYTAGQVPQGQRLHNGTNGTPPTRFGYTELQGSNESPWETFGGDGGDGVLTLVTRAISKYHALVLARHVRRVLHGTALPAGIMSADSHALVRGAVQLVEDFPNPDGGHSAVLRYSTNTVVTA